MYFIFPIQLLYHYIYIQISIPLKITEYFDLQTGSKHKREGNGTTNPTRDVNTMASSIMKPTDEVLREALLNTEMKERALYHQILSFDQTDREYHSMDDLYQVESGNQAVLEKEYKSLAFSSSSFFFDEQITAGLAPT